MEKVAIVVFSLMSAVIIITTAMISATTADTKAAYTTMDSISKKPELKQSLLTTMLISIGLIESIPIIAAVIAIVLVIANPYLGN